MGNETKRLTAREMGRAIAARRTLIGKTQPDIERETNGELYVKLLSRLETGKKPLHELAYSKLRTLIAALDWDATEFANANGVDTSSVSLPSSRPYNATHPVPIFSSVSAGLSPTVQDDYVIGHFTLDPAVSGLRGRNMNNMRIMTVNGDSMASPSVANDIPHGSHIVVELGAAPTDGDIVVAWIDDLEVAVLKRFEEGGTTVLTSYNPSGPVFRAAEHDIDVRGVVRLDFRKR